VVAVALVPAGIVAGVVWHSWDVSVLMFAESVGSLIIAARLVRLGYYAQSNVATGIFCIAVGVGVVGVGLMAGTVGYLFVIAGVIEVGWGVYHVRKPLAPAHT
jgi:hypothetical protein